MDWNAAVEKNREALKRVLAMLVAMAGFGGDAAASPSPQEGETRGGATLPRHLHRFMLRLLRPAEAAARRLVIVAARDLVLPPPRPRKSKPRPCPIFVRPGEMRTGIVLPRGVHRSAILPALARPRPRRLALPLFDPLPRFGGRRRPAARGVPRISVPGHGEPFPIPAPPSSGDPVDAGRLLLRVEALGRALDDLPREARRFALWRARRDAANAEISRELEAAGLQIPVELYRIGARSRSRADAGAQDKKGVRPPLRQWPLRPGRPPGSRRKPTHEVHDILNATHGLAIAALEQFQQKCEAVLRPELRKDEESEQFQQKCEAVLRPELRKDEQSEQFQQKCEADLRPELRKDEESEQFQQKREVVLRPELRKDEESERTDTS